MKNMIAHAILILLAIASVNVATAKSSDLKFQSSVIAINQTDVNAGSIEVTIHDVVVSILVNGDTEIEESGEEIGIAALSAGDFVGIRAFFSAEGIVADDIQILDVREEQFRLKGAISDIDTMAADPTITLLGVRVTITSNTDITQRGSGDGNSVAATDLAVGQLVNVSGSVSEGLLVASRIFVGSRQQGSIELEGDIVSLSDTGLTLSIEGGTTLAIVIDDATSIVGNLAEGSFIEVEGRLLSDMSLTAFEIVVDEDGDGDADDDNERGQRGDKHSSKGGGNGNSSDDDDDSDSDSLKVGAEILLRGDSSGLTGKAEFSYEMDDNKAEQELEIEVEGKEAGSTFRITVFFGDESVDFGSFASDSSGELEVEFKNEGSDVKVQLDGLLPSGKDVRDISKIEISQNDSLVLSGSF